jgi:thiol-disulfide isomerase/thioredoxin
LRQHGILGPKGPSERDLAYEKFDAAVESSRTRDEYADMDDEQLEDLLADDHIIESYRQKRMQEMQDKARRNIFGELMTLSETEFVSQVTEASKLHTVIVHLYKDYIEACKVLNENLKLLARRYPSVKFVRIVSDHCIHGYPDRNVPTLLVYMEGDLRVQLVGAVAVGGKGARADQVERMLRNVNVLPSVEEAVEVLMEPKEDELVDSDED